MGLLDRDPMQVPSPRDDWQINHNEAVNLPRDDQEGSVVKLLRGWLDYAVAYNHATGMDIGQDVVLGYAWAQVGRGLVVLLNFEIGRLDSAFLCKLIEIRLKAEKFKTE